MNFGITALKMLRVLPLSEPRHAQLLACRQIVRTLVDDLPAEASHQLCRALRQILKTIADDPSAMPDEVKQACGLLAELRTVDPRRKVKPGLSPEELIGASPIETSIGTTDEWDLKSSSTRQENARLIEIQRPYEEFYRGKFVLRSGADIKTLVTVALDSLPFTVPMILKLYLYMKRSFESGGVVLDEGPLFSALEEILRNQDALPVDPKAETCRITLEELVGKD